MKTYTGPLKRTRGEDGENKSRTYYLREYDDVTRLTRWVNTKCGSLGAARKYKKKLERAEATDEAPKVDRLLSKAIAGWLASKKPHMTPRGYSTYSGYCDRWLEFFPQTATVRGIEPRLVERYFAVRVAKVSRATVNKERIMLKAFFGWCFDHKLTDDPNPVRTVKKFKEEQREIRALTPQEQERLLKACTEKYKVEGVGIRNAGGVEGGKKTKKPAKWKQTHYPPPWLAPLVRLALATGMRLGTLRALTWREVALERGVIHVPAKKMKARRDLVVPLDGETRKFLKALQKKAKSLAVLEIPDHRAVHRAFQNAVARAKIPACRFHDLRSTFISDLRRANVDLEITARLAGHASTLTTTKFYRQISEAELEAAMERRAQSVREQNGEAEEA